jgi:chromatin remodeling complex protein RSC6
MPKFDEAVVETTTDSVDNTSTTGYVELQEAYDTARNRYRELMASVRVFKATRKKRQNDIANGNSYEHDALVNHLRISILELEEAKRKMKDCLNTIDHAERMPLYKDGYGQAASGTEG